MKSEKGKLLRKIHEIDFAIHELVLFLDTHPKNSKAMQLLQEYRNYRSEKIAEYEGKYGNYVVTVADVKPSNNWEWLNGPWPWENNFMEAK